MIEQIKQIRMSEISMGYCNSCGVVLVDINDMERCPSCNSLFVDYEIPPMSGPDNSGPTLDRTGYTLFKKLG
jgi:hypothetical protein